MAGLINTYSDFIKTNGITGNAYVDSIIITTLLPIAIAWITNIFNSLNGILKGFFNYMWHYLGEIIQSKMIGQIIADIDLYPKDNLYNALKDIFESEKINYPEYQGHFIKKIVSLSETSNSLQYYRKKNLFFMNLINNETKSQINLSEKFNVSKEKIKVFYYKNLYLIIKISEDNEKDRGSISLKVISFQTKKFSKDEIAAILNDFFVEEMNVEKSMSYTYILNISKNYPKINNWLRNFLKNNFANSSTGRLKYGDNKMSDFEEEEKHGKNYLFLDVDNVNFNIENLSENLSFSNNSSSHTQEIQKGGESVLRKYFGVGLASAGYYGFYIDDSKLIFITTEPNCIYIYSKGKRLEDNSIKEIVMNILNEGERTSVKDNVILESKSPSILYSWNDKQWQSFVLEIRTFENIYLPRETMNLIKMNINNFMKMANLYKECNIPYKKGFLFYGPPGSGKSSLIRSLAFEFQTCVYVLNINDDSIDDESIKRILSSIQSSGKVKFLVFEDVDCSFASRNETERKLSIEDVNNDGVKINKKYLTFSGLLNALDGILVNHSGICTIMTTNYREKLDPALIRSGRIDHQIYLGYCTRQQIIDMTTNIINKLLKLYEKDKLALHEENKKYNDKNLLKQKIDSFASNILSLYCNKEIYEEDTFFTPASLQNYILENIENIDNIFDNYKMLEIKYRKN